jgi:hypothetical protein
VSTEGKVAMRRNTTAPHATDGDEANTSCERSKRAAQTVRSASRPKQQPANQSSRADSRALTRFASVHPPIDSSTAAGMSAAEIASSGPTFTQGTQTV